jgi:hypothetical protein
LDGEADRETLLHLQRCAYCREKAEALDRFQKRLKSRVFRANCPSPMELGEYHFRLLPAAQMLLIGQHLRSCPHCAREFAELQTFVSEDMPQPGFAGSIRVLIAQLVKGGEMNQKADQPSFPPALEGVRGNGEKPFIYQAENIQIILEVQEDMEQPDLKMILGLVTGLTSSGFTLQASQEGQTLATSPIDEIGNFTIHQLTPGIYDLTLRGPEIEIQIPSFTV